MADLVSMEMDDERKLDAIKPFEMPEEDYPYGLRISLTDADLKKLDLDPQDATAGGVFTFTAKAKICHVSHNEREDGDKHSHVEAQIIAMHVDDVTED